MVHEREHDPTPRGGTDGDDATSLAQDVPAMQPAPVTEGSDAVWTDRELVDPHARDDKADRVRAMFAAIAGKYDLNNRLHSLGSDQRWRRFAVKRAGVRPDEVVVDVACGTGDLTERFAVASEASRVVGVDFTHEMLEVARDKLPRVGTADGRVVYIRGDAQALPLRDASADVVSIAFGIRNVQDVPQALGEFARVLRPGGRLVVLEFDTPRFAPVRWANSWYSGWLMPRTATLISGDRSGAYRYLPKSVGTFLSADELMSEIDLAGFSDVKRYPLTFGICACYVATLQ